jgi:predicted transcriptional regulator of viral defense system
LTEQLLEHSRALPEGSLLTASSLRRYGKRGAVSKALSRLAQGGNLQRIDHGIYVRPIPTQFGLRPASAESVVASLALLWGEAIASHGAVSANRLGLTTQVPIRAIYLTSGRSRSLQLGNQTLELRHAPAWQFTQAGRLSGQGSELGLTRFGD